MIKCPYNDVASFIYRYKPNKGNNEVKILELGSGDGNNLWYLKKEGFDIKGIELSDERIKNSKIRLDAENLNVEVIQGSFTKLPFKDEEFDMVFDRGAVTCVCLDDAKKTINEVKRVLKKQGYLYLNPYSDLDQRLFDGKITQDGRIKTLYGNLSSYDEGIYFYSIKEILSIFEEKYWKMEELNLLSRKELIKSRDNNSSTLEVIVRKL